MEKSPSEMAANVLHGAAHIGQVIADKFVVRGWSELQGDPTGQTHQERVVEK